MAQNSNSSLLSRASQLLSQGVIYENMKFSTINRPQLPSCLLEPNTHNLPQSSPRDCQRKLDQRDPLIVNISAVFLKLTDSYHRILHYPRNSPRVAGGRC